MRHHFPNQAVLLVVLVAATPGILPAGVIIQNSAYNFNNTGGAGYTLGQSLTTPGGGPWTGIQFNFVAMDGSSFANGPLFLLTQSYSGSPANLSSLTPGFLASTTSIVSGTWQFQPTLTLQPNTAYYFYMTATFDLTQRLRFDDENPYAGGTAWQADSFSAVFSAIPNVDLVFTLQGTAMPEPSSISLFAAGLVLVAFLRLRGH